CDRGQRYCTDRCRSKARREQRRAANRRHQQTPEGRLDLRTLDGYRLRGKLPARPALAPISGFCPSTRMFVPCFFQTRLAARSPCIITSPSPPSGWRSAVIFSILISCCRRGINPQEYLTDVLSRLPTITNKARAPPSWKLESPLPKHQLTTTKRIRIRPCLSTSVFRRRCTACTTLTAYEWATITIRAW